MLYFPVLWLTLFGYHAVGVHPKPSAEHEEVGLVRDHSETHYEAMTYEELKNLLEGNCKV